MVELREPLEGLIRLPSTLTREAAFPRAQQIRLYDATLRDGEQTPGVAFTPEQRFDLACLLSDAGLHTIGMGFPSAAPSERRALKLILDGRKAGGVQLPARGRHPPLRRPPRAARPDRADLLAYAIVLGRDREEAV